MLFAVTGKGGVGKTTMAGLLVTQLIERKCRPVLAVDADPNMCLDSALGVHVEKTVGSVREEAREIAGKGLSTGMSKQQLLEYKISESLVEGPDFDLFAMGRPEGPGCYCYANNVLKQTLQHISDNYPYIVLDNEAGLENLSRRIVQKVDVLIMVTDPSRQGYQTIMRLCDLTKEMTISYDHLVIMVNRMRKPEYPPHFQDIDKQIGAEYVLAIPYDEQLAIMAEEGGDLNSIPADNRTKNSINQLLDHFLNTRH